MLDLKWLQDKVFTEAGLVALLLLLAVIVLWKALTKVRDDHILCLKEQVKDKTKEVENYSDFKTVLRDNVKVLDENNSQLGEVKETLKDLKRVIEVK